MILISSKNITDVTVNGEPAEVLDLNQRDIDIAVFKYWKGLIDFAKKEYGVFQCLELVKIIGAYNEERKKEDISA